MSHDVASIICQASGLHHVIQHILSPSSRFLTSMASYDVASIIYQALGDGGQVTGKIIHGQSGGAVPGVGGRGLHSFTFQLNLSRV